MSENDQQQVTVLTEEEAARVGDTEGLDLSEFPAEEAVEQGDEEGNDEFEPDNADG